MRPIMGKKWAGRGHELGEGKGVFVKIIVSASDSSLRECHQRGRRVGSWWSGGKLDVSYRDDSVEIHVVSEAVCYHDFN